MNKQETDSCGVYISFISINVIIVRNLTILYYNLGDFLPKKKEKGTGFFFFILFLDLNTHQRIQCSKIVGGGRAIGFKIELEYS